MKYELRFLDINPSKIKKTISKLDKNTIKEINLLRWDSFDYKDKYLRVRDEGNGNVTLTLKTGVKSETQPTSKTIFVNDYFTTLDILSEIDIKSKYRVEKIREIWKLSNGCILNFDMFPGLPYYLEIKSNNKKKLENLVKKLNLEIDTRKHIDLGADTMYYDLYGIPKSRGPMGDLTFNNAKKIFIKLIKKNKALFEEKILEQSDIIKLITK